VIALSCFAGVFLVLWRATLTFFPPLMRGVRSGVGRLARWLRGSSRLGPLFGRLETWRSYLPLVVALAIGTLIIVWTADAFTDLAAALKAHSPTVQRIDAAVHEWFGSRRTPFTSALFVTVTTVGGAVGIALAIGISRVYLGVHWTSDVGAGFAAGLLWVTATTTGYELFRQYRLGQADMAQRRAKASA
jgi:membrane-associated phospholipid phosphatase